MSESIKKQLNSNQLVFISEETNLLDPNKVWEALISSPRTFLKKGYRADVIDENIHLVGDIVGVYNEKVKEMDKAIDFMKKVSEFKKSQKVNEIVEQTKVTEPIQQKIEEQQEIEEIEIIPETPATSLKEEQGVIIGDETSEKPPVIDSKTINTENVMAEQVEIKKDTPIVVQETVKEKTEIQIKEVIDKVEEDSTVFDKSEEIKVETDGNTEDEKVEISNEIKIEAKSVDPTKTKEDIFEKVKPVDESQKPLDNLSKEKVIAADTHRFDPTSFKEVKGVDKSIVNAHEKQTVQKSKAKTKQKKKSKFNTEFKEVTTRKIDEDFPLVKIQKDKNNQGSLALFLMLIKSTNEESNNGGKR